MWKILHVLPFLRLDWLIDWLTFKGQFHETFAQLLLLAPNFLTAFSGLSFSIFSLSILPLPTFFAAFSGKIVGRRWMAKLSFIFNINLYDFRLATIFWETEPRWRSWAPENIFGAQLHHQLSSRKSSHSWAPGGIVECKFQEIGPRAQLFLK